MKSHRSFTFSASPRLAVLAVALAAVFSGGVQAASMPAVEAKNGMVVSSQHLASKVGVEILKMGGNAVDAAVAVGYAQAVVNPCCGNIGGGGFMTITNKGAEADRLVSIAAPEVSDDVQIHEMAVENNVMKMRQLPEGIEIPAGGTVELKSGGLHVMFMKIKHPFKEGESFKATLTFEKAGPVEVNFKIEAARPAAAQGGDASANHEGHGG